MNQWWKNREIDHLRAELHEQRRRERIREMRRLVLVVLEVQQKLESLCRKRGPLAMPVVRECVELLRSIW
jgi:hypothetical protein